MNTGKFVGFNAQTFYVTFGPKYISTAVLRVSATSRHRRQRQSGRHCFRHGGARDAARQSVNVKYSGKMRDWKLTEVAPCRARSTSRSPRSAAAARSRRRYQVEVTLEVHRENRPAFGDASPHQDDRLRAPVVQVTVTANVASPLEIAPGKVRFDTIAVGQSASRVIVGRRGPSGSRRRWDRRGSRSNSRRRRATARPVPDGEVRSETARHGGADPPHPHRSRGGIATLPVEGQGCR